MKKTIAIVSDDIFFPHLFLILLKRKFQELEIIVSKTLQEIDESSIMKSCDLVLLDGGMTRMSSIEVIQYIRTNQLIVAPIWFFTEIETESYILKSKQLGASLIVDKPFDPHKVTDEIASLLLN
jgi:DNA-binding response OmpR family regulator